MQFDFDQLWRHVGAQFHARQDSLHGPAHWRRVERHGRLLAARTGADETVVRLFALFHDSCRLNDGHDPGLLVRQPSVRHGVLRASSLRRDLFRLTAFQSDS